MSASHANHMSFDSCTWKLCASKLQRSWHGGSFQCEHHSKMSDWDPTTTIRPFRSILAMIDSDTCVSDRAKAQAGLRIGAVPGIPPQWHASSLDVGPPQ